MTLLTIGKRHFSNHLIQAPLAGISCAPFRLLTWQHSAPAYTVTEMISCKTLLHAPRNTVKRYTYISEGEGPVCFQLSANNAYELAEATKVATDSGAAILDLNCGCPVKKIRSRGAGSKILATPSTLYQLISAMKTNTHLPITVKIRVQSQFTDIDNCEVAKAIGDAGVDALIVHGRHWTEHYETPVNYSQISYFVNALKPIPVIGNGDVACIQSYKKMLATGCAGVMIGRAGVGQPWLIKQLNQELISKTYIPPSIPEVGQMLLQHITALITLSKHEKFAIFSARKFARFYARTLPNKVKFNEQMQQISQLDEVNKLIQEYFI